MSKVRKDLCKDIYLHFSTNADIFDGNQKVSLPRKEFVGVERDILSLLADNIFSPDFSTGSVIYHSLLPKRSSREFIS